MTVLGRQSTVREMGTMLLLLLLLQVGRLVRILVMMQGMVDGMLVPPCICAWVLLRPPTPPSLQLSFQFIQIEGQGVVVQ